MQQLISMIWAQAYKLIKCLLPSYKVQYMGYTEQGYPIYLVTYGYHPFMFLIALETNSYLKACLFVKEHTGSSPLATI